MSLHKTVLREAGLSTHGTHGECLQRIACDKIVKSKGVQKPLRYNAHCPLPRTVTYDIKMRVKFTSALTRKVKWSIYDP